MTIDSTESFNSRVLDICNQAIPYIKPLGWWRLLEDNEQGLKMSIADYPDGVIVMLAEAFDELDIEIPEPMRAEIDSIYPELDKGAQLRIDAALGWHNTRYQPRCHRNRLA